MPLSAVIERSTVALQETALISEEVTIDQKPLKEHLDAIGHKEAYDYQAIDVLSLKGTSSPREVMKTRLEPLCDLLDQLSFSEKMLEKLEKAQKNLDDYLEINF